LAGGIALSVAIANVPGERPVAPVSVLRWAGLAGLLLGEVLALTLRYDTASLANEAGPWARLLGEAPLLLRLGIAVAAATLLFGGAGLWAELRRAYRPTFPWVALAAHLALFAGFAWLTGVVLEGHVLSSAYGAAWTLAWGGLGLATLLTWGWTAVPVSHWPAILRQSWGAFAVGGLAGVIAWGASLTTDRSWQPLAQATFAVVRGLLTLSGADTVADPHTCVLGTTTYTVRIAPACSGYEGIGLIWTFLGLYLWFFRDRLRFPQAWLLPVLGTAVIWLVNALRIALLILIGSWGAPQVAQGGFHSQAGWLAFNGIALGLVALTGRWRFFNVLPQTARETNPTAAYLAPLVVLLVAAMVASALVPDPDQLYPLRVLAVAGVLALCWRHYTDWQWSWSWTAVAIGAAVFVLWLALEPAFSANTAPAAPPAALAQGPTAWAALWLLFRVLGAVLTVPLAEELAFRGYLIRRVTATDFQAVPPGRFSWLGFLVSSVLFGILHPGRWLAGTGAGMAYALALRRRGQVADAFLAHATTNALLAAYVLTTGSWSLWS
jgi:exosortase E/protease (VPEID-CTERM system)